MGANVNGDVVPAQAKNAAHCGLPNTKNQHTASLFSDSDGVFQRFNHCSISPPNPHEWAIPFSNKVEAVLKIRSGYLPP